MEALAVGGWRVKRRLAGPKESAATPSPPLTLPEPIKPPATPAKKLKAVPRNEPRSIENVGRYTFRHGVRIGDYKVPRQRPNSSPPESLSYRCRDGFEGLETSLGSPQPWIKRHGQGSTSSGSTALTPLSASWRHASQTSGMPYAVRVSESPTWEAVCEGAGGRVEIKTEGKGDGDEYHGWLMGNQPVEQIIRFVRTSNS